MLHDGIVHVIDDDDAVRDALGFMFDAAGLEARCWESAVTFLADAQDLDQGCIVTDVRMPDMTGLELVVQLKARGGGAPVIVIDHINRPISRHRRDPPP